MKRRSFLQALGLGAVTIAAPVAVAESKPAPVVRTSISTGTLAEVQAIEDSSFRGAVTIDIESGVAGTSFPIGTAHCPVNNYADALKIAEARGLPFR